MTDKIEDVFVRHIHAYTPSQIADGILAGEFVRETEFVLAHEVERLRTFEAAHRQLLADLDTATRERDEARAEIENLYDQVHRWVDDRAKAQLQADRLREQNYELQRERDEARAEVEDLRDKTERLQSNNDNLTLERDETRAEVERLRAALRDIERGDYSDPMCERTPEQRAREALEAKP